MNNRSAKGVLSRSKLMDEAIGVVVANYGKGIITINYFDQLNEKYVEGLCWFPQIPRGIAGGVSNPGVAVSEMAEVNLQGMIYYIKH